MSKKWRVRNLRNVLLVVGILSVTSGLIVPVNAAAPKCFIERIITTPWLVDQSSAVECPDILNEIPDFSDKCILVTSFRSGEDAYEVLRCTQSESVCVDRTDLEVIPLGPNEYYMPACTFEATTICDIYQCPSAATTTQISTGLAERVNNFYIWALGIGGMVALGIIIFGGVLYSASGGNPGRMGEAKTWIQHALFGLALLFSSYLILNFINPDLTRLEEVLLDPNPRVQGPTLEILPGASNSLFTALPITEDCGGFYHVRNALKGNFGDTRCEYASAISSDSSGGTQGRTAFVGLLRNVVRSELEKTDHCDANIDYITTVMVDQVAGCETGWSYNPNSYNPKSTSGLGAYGLFQMNPSSANRPYDQGDVPWREQAENAIQRYNNYSPSYWACWNRLNISETVPCNVN